MANILSQDELDSLLQEMKQLREGEAKPAQEKAIVPPVEQIQRAAPQAPADINLELALSIPVRLSAELGRTYLNAVEILRLAPGSTITLNTRAEDELLKLTVKDQVIARGEVVVKDEKFALRLTEVSQAREIINKLNS